MACNYHIDGRELTKDEFLKYVSSRPLSEVGGILGIAIPPAAPFVMETPSWVKLGLKTALREAVKQGATKIAWTTGEQQISRYDLSKVISKIRYQKTGTATSDNPPMYHIESFYKSGESASGSYRGDELEGVVGKEIAEKIINDEGEALGTIRREGGLRVLSGIDLKVGGKGMIGFYGSPESNKLGIVGEVAKGLFKQTPETTELTEGVWKEEDGRQVFEGADGTYIGDYSKQRRGQYRAVDMFGKEKLFDKENDAKDYIYNSTNFHATRQHSITITDELRQEVGQGLPLFQIIGEQGAQNTLKQQRLEERQNSAAARVERARLGLIEAYGEWIAPGAINDPLKNWDSTRKLIGRLLEYAIARGIKTKEDLIALVKKEISAAGGGYKAIEDYIVKAVLRGIRAYDKSDKDDLQLTELLVDIRGDIETAPNTLYKLFDETESPERKGKILKFINVMLTERQEQLEGLEVPEATGLADVEAKLTEALDLHIDPDTVFGRRDQTNWATFDTDQKNEAALKPNTVRSIQHALAFLSGWHNEYIKHSNGNSTQFVRFVANWLQTPAGQNAVSAGSLRAGLMQLVKDLKRDKKPNTPNAVYSNMEKIVKQLSGGADWASSMGAAFRSLQRNIFDRLNTEQFGNMVDRARSLVDAINTTPISEEAADPDNHRVIKARHNASKGSAEARRVVSPKPSHRRRAKGIISNTNRQNMEDRVKRIKEAIKKCK